ncbi:MAG: DUF2950 domain-containing protein [Planctomycetes bacterium]|nr:DUF2950 domain-containing protein [Planctomycetota bacterium]
MARLVDGEGKPLALIAPELGAADLRPLPASAKLAPASPQAPWHGYRFAAIAADGFAFIASPAERGVTGWMTLVVSEDGAVWGKDLGEATGKDAVTAPPTAEETAGIAAAIRDLDAEALAVREGADAKLRGFGRKAKVAMQEALTGAGAEPRRRLRDLLHDLEETAPDLRKWPGETKDLLDAGWERL